MPARNVNAVIVLIKENVVTLSYIHHILVPSFQVNVFDFLVWESGIPIILLKLFCLWVIAGGICPETSSRCLSEGKLFLFLPHMPKKSCM